jgi:outer membrane protein assembly factor BamE (lipoprotein component of BamABCDE complex)
MRERSTKTVLRGLAAGAIMFAGACVSTGNKAIVDPSLGAQLAVNKSTKAEVQDRLGFPDIAAYPLGQEVWEYFYKTITPKPYNYLPIIKIVNGFNQETRALIITFNREGIVKKVEWQQLSDQENSLISQEAR